MTESGSMFLEVRVAREIHQSLALDVSLNLGLEAGILFGASGAGKTSLLRLISGLSRPDSGRICLGGETLFDSANHINTPLRQRKVGMIFQDDRLFPHLSVAANVAFGLKGWKGAPARRRLAEIAALCGVEHLLGRLPQTLSGGERQRVGLARALAPCPRLLLCDEPVSALDMTNRFALLEQLRIVQKTLDIPMLYVTHSPSEALTLGSRLFLLKAGRVVAAGTPLDVLSNNTDVLGESKSWQSLRNTFSARITGHDEALSASLLELDGGPSLIVPFLDRSPGTRLLVAITADDILLSRSPLTGLSARNQISGQVERLVRHGSEAEVIVRTNQLIWIVSVVENTLEQLAIVPGATVHMVIKARSCRILGLDGNPAAE